jgi:hypothetical protein
MLASYRALYASMGAAGAAGAATRSIVGEA